jgi:Protein of unknown function (DUF992)
MRGFLIVATTFASALLVTAGSQAQSPPGPWTQVGGLSCQLAPSIGLIVMSQQKMTCVFTPNQPSFPVQRYAGTMTNLGIDLGATAGGVLGWAVFSSTIGPGFGGLAGTYVGASGEATIGVGAGANVLLGGSARSVALQPLSLQGTVGLNVSLGVAGLELIALP